MIKGAIFDVDGTLLDSMHIWDSIGEDYLRSLGYEPREKLNEKFKTMSLAQAAAYYRSEYGVTLSVERICAEVNGRIENFYRDEAQLKPGAAEFLERLAQKGIKLAIATATDDYLVEAALRRCGVVSLFSGLFTCAMTGRGKTEPDIYRTAAARLGTQPRETLVFEDALYALKTARAAGFPTAAVYDPHEPGQKELRELADYYIEDFSSFIL